MVEYIVKIYKRKRDGTLTANLVRHSYKKGKAIKMAKVNI
jgi:hypothetical protein